MVQHHLQFAQGQVVRMRDQQTLDQIAGLKLRVPGGVGSAIGEALGATGIQVPAPKVYETLASNAADGVVMPVDSRKGFNLIEVAPHLYEMPGGFYRGSFAFIMNEDTFAGLPEDIRQALEENVFGEPLSREIGKIWDGGDIESLEATKTAEGNTITVASPEDQAKFNEIAAGVVEAVIEEVAATGVDARAAHEMIMKDMAAY